MINVGKIKEIFTSLIYFSIKILIINNSIKINHEKSHVLKNHFNK